MVKLNEYIQEIKNFDKIQKKKEIEQNITIENCQLEKE